MIAVAKLVNTPIAAKIADRIQILLNEAGGGASGTGIVIVCVPAILSNF